MAINAEKYVLTGPNGECIAMKRELSGNVTIGGNGRFMPIMQEIVQGPFGRKSLPRGRWITANKVRLIFAVSDITWKSGKEVLVKSGYNLNNVVSTGRIMR